MIPLRVAATVHGAVALSAEGVALDALLAWAVARRDNLPTVEEQQATIEIPVQRDPSGRFHLATLGQYELVEHDNHWINRRFPIEQAQTIGAPSFKRVLLSTGATKSYRLPLAVGYLRDSLIEWWCIGDADAIRDLLAIVPAVGKKRGVGKGEVERWTVEECSPWAGFPVVRDGRPLRQLPPDWPGITDGDTGYRCLTYPYWQRTREELCAVPL